MKKEYFPEVYEEQEHFDSSVEERFVKRVSSLRKDWNIIREPTILKAGPSAMIPDFSLERRGKKLYIEIVGFWTPEYLVKKIEKVNALHEEILLCVSKELQCTRKDFRKKNVDIIFYDKDVPLKPILDRIRKIESEQLREEKEKISRIVLDLKEDITQLDSIAREHDVGVEAVREMLRGNNTGVVVQDIFVKNAVITEIREKLEGLEDMRLSSVKEILNEYHLDEAVLKKVGYEVAWTTLDLESAVVRKVHVDDGNQSW
jgi:hypothetical protein